MEQISEKFLKWWFGEDLTNWCKSETQLAVLAVILQKSRKQNQIITAVSIRQIKAGLKKDYYKDLSQRQILNVIQRLGKIVVKEKDPRNHRRSLYRINSTLIEETVITIVKLNGDNIAKSNGFEGILCYPLLSTEKKKYLVISHKH